MKKSLLTTIATAGVATIAIADMVMRHMQREQGYNPNDPTSYDYSYTIDQQGNYHYTWKGNWSPNQVNHSSQSNYSYNNYSYNYNNYNNYNNYSNNTQSYSANTQQTGGLGASYSTSDRNIKVTTTTAPSSQSTGVSISRTSSSGSNLYTLVNVHIMYLIELAVKSVQLGEMLTTGQGALLQVTQ